MRGYGTDSDLGETFRMEGRTAEGRSSGGGDERVL